MQAETVTGRTGTAQSDRRQTALVKVGAAALKLGPKLLPLLKVFKSGKFLLLFASLGGYAWLWGPLVGAGVLALIAVHESGHVWAMKRAGLKTKGMYFLPFMGAVAVVDENLKSRWQEYWLTIMGPVFGLGGVLAALAVYQVTGHGLFLALTLFGAFLNLVNLLPMLPLDGGRILRSITLSQARGRWGFAAVAGVAVAAGAFAWKSGFWLFGFFGLIGLWELYGDYKRTRAIRGWREQFPVQAAMGDMGMLRDAEGNPVEVPREVTPMSGRACLLGAAGAVALALVLAAIWMWAVRESGITELMDIFG